jgi:arylsulfatase A-like enzyme
MKTVESMDIFATVLNLCGIGQPAGSRAYSLLRKDYTPRTDVYAEGGLVIAPAENPFADVTLRVPYSPSQFDPGAMLRTDKWKLYAHSFDCRELYDLEKAPKEICNVYNDPTYVSVVQALTVRLTQRMLCHGQAPEHLPLPVLTGMSVSGLPLRDDVCTDIMSCAGIRPNRERQPKRVQQPEKAILRNRLPAESCS